MNNLNCEERVVNPEVDLGVKWGGGVNKAERMSQEKTENQVMSLHQRQQ